MISILVFATDTEIDDLLSTPENIEQFMGEERTSADLDKAWHGIQMRSLPEMKLSNGFQVMNYQGVLTSKPC